MDSLLTLKAIEKQDWKIRVRVSRKWYHLRQNKKTAGVSMILVDENEIRMHAWMNSRIMLRLDGSILEGDIFDIENFMVKPYGNNERNQCFTGDKRIFFTDTTIVKPSTGPHDFIPKHVFNCIPLNMVGQHASQDTYLIDVCGIVRDLEPIQHFVTITGKEQIFARFLLADNRSPYRYKYASNKDFIQFHPPNYHCFKGWNSELGFHIAAT
ncbi:hypothetical protein DCAR_0520110 [Daucus carota subsp. sativus]|uniref:Replication protein A 70 kDa DNA-binding subunit B/D first OB fold domain-containing protein n=1 Tax=Daucus carota subsp. sativus TaxID=79200 RepID=A0AAF0X6L1_DAUCS|nr:hypothetical protein DCAR_0520110 [Daucus carota subsp. sativus]